MEKYDEILEKISSNNNIPVETINLLTKYIISLEELKIINKKEEIDKLIDKTETCLESVTYYDNEDEEFCKKIGVGKKNKGCSVGNKIYINKNMSEELKVVTLFHEFTHFLQRYHIEGYSECVGIMRDFKWRLLMEGQTQNIAEMIYEHIYKVNKEEKKYKSEELRMKSGGVIISNRRNYELYDYVLKKLLLALEISLDDFIYLNFNGKLSMPIFEKMLEIRIGAENKNKLSKLLDIIYTSDILKYYYDDVDKLKEPYIVKSLYNQRAINVSCYNQFETMKKLDDFLLEITEENEEVHSKLLRMKFIQSNELESIIDEQYYTTHYENGVETIKRNTLHI